MTISVHSSPTARAFTARSTSPHPADPRSRFAHAQPASHTNPFAVPVQPAAHAQPAAQSFAKNAIPVKKTHTQPAAHTNPFALPVQPAAHTPPAPPPARAVPA